MDFLAVFLLVGFLALRRLAAPAVALLADLAVVPLVGFLILRLFAVFVFLLEAARLAPKPSDMPISIPLARVAKFCVSRCAVLKLVSRCARIAACARFA